MANGRVVESELSFIESLSVEQRERLYRLLEEDKRKRSVSLSLAAEEQRDAVEVVRENSSQSNNNKTVMAYENNSADDQQKGEKEEWLERSQVVSLEAAQVQENSFLLDVEKRKSSHAAASIEFEQADLISPFDREKQPEKEFSSIFEAARAGNIKGIEKFLAQGVTLTGKDKRGLTALLCAAWEGHTETVQLLLDRGATLNEKDKDGMTGLLWATRKGHFQTVQLLLDRSAALTEKDKDGMTGLLWAARNGHFQTVQLLLDRGSELTEKNNVGRTALLWAAWFGRTQTVQLLLERGARLVEKDIYMVTLPWAGSSGPTQTVQLLLTITGKEKEGDPDRDLLLRKERNRTCLRPWLTLYEAIQFKKIGSQLQVLKLVLAYYEGHDKSELYLCSARLLLSLPCEPLLTHPKLTEFEKQELKFLLVTPYEKAVEKKESFMHFVFSMKCYWEPYKLQVLLAYLKEKEQRVPKIPLTHITISGSLWPIEESWLMFIRALPSFSLHSLELSNCQLKDRALLALAHTLLDIPTLITCVLDQNQMSYRGFRDFIKIICRHPALRRLSLRENRIEETDKKQLDKDVGAVLREAREQNPLLQPIDISGNYLMSKGHNPTQLNVLRLLLRKTGLSVQEFSQAEWLRERDSARVDHTVLCLQVNEEGRDFDVPVDVMGALTTYRDELRLGSDAKTFKDLQMSIAAALRYYPHLKAVRLSEIEAHAIKEQKKVCKSLLFYHKAAPLKSYLRCDSHSLLHTQKLEQTACLLDPQQSVTRREWNVYFLAKWGSDMMEIIKDRVIKEHAMIGWEGVYSYGQRVIKMAELTVETRRSALGVITTKQLVISYFSLEIERIDSFRKHYIFATFRASKEKVKEMERTIDSEVGDLPGKYKKILGSSGSEVSGGQLSPEDQEKVTTNCQKWALEKLERCLDLAEKTLQREMAVRPSATGLALQTLPAALKKEGGVQREELEVKEAPQEGSRCVLM